MSLITHKANQFECDSFVYGLLNFFCMKYTLKTLVYPGTSTPVGRRAKKRRFAAHRATKAFVSRIRTRHNRHSGWLHWSSG